MKQTHELLNRPLFAKNAFFTRTPFGNRTSPSNPTATAKHGNHSAFASGAGVNSNDNTVQNAHTKQSQGKHNHHTKNRPHNASQPQFDLNHKPDPVSFYARYGITLKGKQTNIKCVFHSDKTPSLSINADTGAFYCFGCGASGGDVLDFYQRYHSCDFLTACHELNLSQY